MATGARADGDVAVDDTLIMTAGAGAEEAPSVCTHRGCSTTPAAMPDAAPPPIPTAETQGMLKWLPSAVYAPVSAVALMFAGTAS